jgi:hypothetical protein
MTEIDVYVSYSHQDRRRVQLIADRLELQGLRVFWDRELQAGETFRNVIATAIDTSKCVLVVWSENSVRSAFVRDEADLGAVRNKLIPIRIDPVELPLGFSQYHTANLIGWDGDPRGGDFPRILEAIRTFVGQDAGAATRVDGITPNSQDEKLGERVVAEKKRPYRRPIGAASTSVFIAHTSGDKPRIAPIVDVLATSGFSIWIDKPHLLKLGPRAAKRVRGIEFGSGDWKEQIRQGVRRAKVVLALWSDDAIDARREQFYYEVYMALVQGKLCQARLDPLPPNKIGMPFTFDQIADLSDFKSDTYHPELDFMIGGFAKFRRRLL